MDFYKSHAALRLRQLWPFKPVSHAASKPLLIVHWSFQSARRRWKRGYTSALSLPLKSDGTLFGALTIYADDPGKLDEPIVEQLRQWSDLFTLRVKTLRSLQERDLNKTTLTISLLVSGWKISFG